MSKLEGLIRLLEAQKADIRDQLRKDWPTGTRVSFKSGAYVGAQTGTVDWEWFKDQASTERPDVLVFVVDGWGGDVQRVSAQQIVSGCLKAI